MTPARSDGVHRTSNACTDARLLPVVDTLGWVYGSFRTGSALLASDSAYQGKTLQRGPDLALSGALLVLYAASAGYGFSSAAECEQVRESEESAPPRCRRSRALAPPDAPSSEDAPPAAAAPADGGLDVDAASPADGGESVGVPILPAPPAVVPRPAPPAIPQRGADP
jgi:hypothetical protein